MGIEVIRPVSSILLAAAAWVASVVAGAGFADTSVLLGMLAVFLAAGGGFSIEAYFDSKTREGSEFAFSVLLMAVGIIISYIINVGAFVVAILIASLLTAYGAHIKKTMIISNVVLSLTAAFAFVYGGAVAENLLFVLPLALLIFLTNTGFEIYRTIDEAVADHKYNEHSVAIKLGVIHTRLLGNIFLTSAVIFSFLPFFLGAGKTYLFFAIIADIFLITACIAPSKYSSKMVTIGIPLIVIAFLSAALI